MNWKMFSKKGIIPAIACGALIALCPWSMLHAASVHTIQPGDTLWQISRQYEVPLEKIYELNGLNQSSVLRVGMNIKLSGTGTESSSSNHTIKPGDSLWDISRHYNVSLRSLLEANGFSEQTILRVGQTIKIPSVTAGTGQTSSQSSTTPSMVSYVIKPGDNLWDISRHYNVSLRSLLEANGFSEQTILRVGQTIKIPSVSGSSNVSQAQSKPTVTSHTVQAGESLWLIARIYGVSLRSILEANSLNESSILRVGTKLSIPTDSGVTIVSAASTQPTSESFTYTVCAGDTLWGIARKFDVNLQTLMGTNNLTSSSRLQINQKLVIPGGQTTRPVSGGSSGEYETYQVRSGDSLWNISRHYRVSLDQLMQANGLSQNSVLRVGQIVRIPAYITGNYGTRSDGMAWPLNGRISSPYGRRSGGFHNGIDITSPAGTPIRAAMSGVVSFSGWITGYGRTVIIDHPNGLQTLYAHNQVNLVSRGQRINQGEAIARVGISGNATGYHVHFEVRRSGRHVDPMEYLRR